MGKFVHKDSHGNVAVGKHGEHASGQNKADVCVLKLTCYHMNQKEQIRMKTDNAYEQFEQKHGVEPEVFLSFMSISQLLDLAKHLGVSFGEYEGGICNKHPY